MKYQKVYRALLVFCYMGCNAQEYLPAYILPSGMDTLHGFVLNETDGILAKGIVFKNSVDGAARTYSPRDLSGFGFATGRHFLRQSVSKNDSDSSWVFAKKIIDGKLTVLSWRKDGKDDPDFFIKNNYSARKVHLTESGVKQEGVDGNRTTVHNVSVYQGFLSFVKGDSINSYPPLKKVRYSERSINRDIIAYNEKFNEQFPILQYQEQVRLSYSIAVGFPFSSTAAKGFRMSVFRNKEFPEKSRTVSLIQGVSYRNWKNKRSTTSLTVFPMAIENHYFSILPFGFNFHSAKGPVRPFLAVALGGVVWVDTYLHLDGRNTKTHLSFTGNLGAGLLIEAGSDFVTLEITPSRNQLFFNIGFAF